MTCKTCATCSTTPVRAKSHYFLITLQPQWVMFVWWVGRKSLLPARCFTGNPLTVALQRPSSSLQVGGFQLTAYVCVGVQCHRGQLCVCGCAVSQRTAIHVWACKVVSGEFVCGELHVSQCVHRMGGNRSTSTDPDIGLKHKMPLHFLLSVFSSMLRWIFTPTGQAQHTRAAQSGSSISLYVPPINQIWPWT